MLRLEAQLKAQLVVVGVGGPPSLSIPQRQAIVQKKSQLLRLSRRL